MGVLKFDDKIASSSLRWSRLGTGGTFMWSRNLPIKLTNSTGKARFKKTFFFLKSRVWFKKHLCTETKKQSAEKKCLMCQIIFIYLIGNIIIQVQTDLEYSVTG